jgi:hypothetical protein
MLYTRQSAPSRQSVKNKLNQYFIMEENIPPSDHLDDFVRKSFDGYEENPSGDMWQRIEGALEPPVAGTIMPQPAVGASLLHRWGVWAVAATFLLLAGGWLFTYRHYENKIMDLEKTVQAVTEQQKAENEQVIEQIVAAKIQEWESKNDKKQSEYEKKTLKESVFRHDAGLKTASEERVPAATVSTTMPLLEDPTNAGFTKGQEKKNETGVEKSAFNAERTGSDSAVFTTNLNARALDAPLSIARSPLSMVQSQVHFHTPLLGFTPSVQRPNNASTGWYAGVRASVNRTKEQQTERPKAPIDRPGPRPWGRTPAFVNEINTPLVNMEWGITVGKKINRHFGMESGASWVHTRQESVHTPRFEFRDGRPHSFPGGPQHNQFDFDYNLNTYGGSAAVSLRMEKTDNVPVSQNDTISLQITTRRQTDVLKVPVLGVASIGKGRVHVLLKAGPEGHFIVRNNLDIDVLTSGTTRFRPDPDNPPKPEFETQRRFAWGYRAAAGLEYRFTQRISAVAESVLSGAFAQTDHLRQRLPGVQSTGINLALQYHF